MEPKLERGRTLIIKNIQAIIRLIPLPTCILTLAIFIVSKHWPSWFDAENFFGGIYRHHPPPPVHGFQSLSMSRQKSLLCMISLSLILPGYNWLTKVIQPLGEIQTSLIRRSEWGLLKTDKWPKF